MPDTIPGVALRLPRADLSNPFGVKSLKPKNLNIEYEYEEYITHSHASTDSPSPAFFVGAHKGWVRHPIVLGYRSTIGDVRPSIPLKKQLFWISKINDLCCIPSHRQEAKELRWTSSCFLSNTLPRRKRGLLRSGRTGHPNPYARQQDSYNANR